MKLLVRNYYRGEKDLDEVRVDKVEIDDYKDIDDAYEYYTTPEIKNYILLNWAITERKEVLETQI